MLHDLQILFSWRALMSPKSFFNLLGDCLSLRIRFYVLFDLGDQYLLPLLSLFSSLEKLLGIVITCCVKG